MRLILVAAALSLLAACATSTTPPAAATPAPASAPPADPLAALSKFTLNDLQHASAIGKAGGDKLGPLCYDWLAAQLQAQSSSDPNATVAGLISAFEKARLLQQAVSNGISQDFQIHCAPLLSDAQSNLLRLGALGAGVVTTGGLLP